MHGHLQAEDCAADVLADAGIAPVVQADAPKLDARVLQGEGYHLVCLINPDTKERPIPAGKQLSLRCGAQGAKKITFYTPEEEAQLSFRTAGDCLQVTLPEIKQGGFVLIEE